ncbi:uncharacterized protein [Prorops nasuta]
MEINNNKRHENFLYKEKLELAYIFKDYAMIVENKITDAVEQIEKNKAWELIGLKFNKNMHRNVNAESLKKLWQNIKLQTRKHYAKMKQELYKTGGGINKIATDLLYDKTYELIHISVDGPNNPYDNDSKSAQNTGLDITEEIILDEENEDPNSDPVFQYLTEKGEIDKWAKWNPKKLSKPLSKPLHTSVQMKSTIGRPTSSNTPKSTEGILLQSKIELNNLMIKELEEKSVIEKQILSEKLTKEKLKVTLLKRKLNECGNNNIAHIIETSDSSN